MKRLAVLWIVLPALASVARATPPGDERHHAIQEMFAPYDAPGSPGVAVGVYSKGAVEFLGGYGLADLEQGTRITPQTVFHVASVSKQFAAFAAALLAREGRLDLDADVRADLPCAPPFGRAITSRQLIHHTSGLRDQWSLFELGGQDYRGVLLQQQVVSMVCRQSGLNFEPGTDYSYSNTGYTLLAEVLRARSGESFRQLTGRRIFGPLGMTRSFFYDDLSEIVPARANSYDRGDVARPWRRALLNMQTYGATSLFTTVEDLLKWAGNLARPVVGDRRLIEQVTAMGSLDDGSPINYGFGLRRDAFGGHSALSHTGHDAGFNTVFAFFPEADFAVVLLANHGTPLFPHVESIVRLYLGKPRHPVPAAPAATAPSARLVQELEGDYVAGHGALVSLAAREGGLEWRALSVSDDRPGACLVFRGDGSFDLGERARAFSEYRVRRDSKGTVQGFDQISNVGGGRVTPYRRAQRAVPSGAELAAIAGDYYSPELDITYRLRVRDGALLAESLWTASPITFTPSVRDRFDAPDGRLPTIIVERDAAGRPARLRVEGEYLRGVLLERRER